MKETILTISGMSCGHCVKAVEEALRSLEGVGEVRVEIGKAVVAHDPARASVESMLAAIKDAGYESTP